DRSAGGVDEDGGRLHPGQFCCTDQVAGGFAERDMQAHDVGSLEKLLKCRNETTDSRVVAGGVDHLHVETLGPLRDGTPDAAETDQSERRSVHVAGEVGTEAP